MTGSLFAFQFQPITQDFSPSGNDSRKSFLATNSSNSPIPVKVSMVHREMDIDGKETLTNASDLFFIFPSQFVLPANSTQTVRVQWRGPSSVTTELPFRVVAEQLPIALNTNQNGVQVLLKYQGSVYVTPSKFTYGIKVNRLTKTTDEVGNQVLEIELENTGNTHQLLADPILTLKQGTGIDYAITGEALGDMLNQNILAGNRRVFTIPWPEGLQTGVANATISLEPKR